MELIYIWINEYRTYKDTGINLSDKFTVKYNQKNNNITIERNKNYLKLYPENILNVSAFIGKNSAGKSNLLDLLGMRIEDRNSMNEEFYIKYKPKKPGQFGYKYPDDVEKEIKGSRYFFLYYLGKDNDNEHMFCLEGNDIDSYLDIFTNKEKISDNKSLNYWREKYWFAFVCKYQDGKLIYKYDVTDDGGMDRKNNRYIQTTKNKATYILFREKYNPVYYNQSSFESKDDYKITIPRRIAKLNSEYLYKKIEFLIEHIKKNNGSELYSDKNYILSINYHEPTEYEAEDINICNFEKLSNESINNEEDICKILFCFCLYTMIKFFPNRDNNSNEQEFFNKVNQQMLRIKFKGRDYKNVKEYYWNIIQCMAYNFFRNGNNSINNKNSNHFLDCYKNLEDSLEKILINSKNSSIKIISNNININKISDKNLVLDLIKATIDETIDSEINETYTVINNFFSYKIYNLSDGEQAYLGLMTSIDEQISVLTQIKDSVEKKKEYILLLDEPENRMHPELARTFIKSAMDFLSQYKDKTFQIIIASHSPFLISDIPRANVFTIRKENSSSIINICTIDTFGQNIHTLLKSAFFMDDTIGEYAREKIEEVKKFLDMKLDNKNYNEEMTIDKAEKIIDLIGEGILKTALQEKLKKVKTTYMTHELKSTIKIYDKLSNDEKRKFIKHIIDSQEGKIKND